MSDEFLYNNGIRIKTTQCDESDFVTIMPVEIKGQEFPWERDEILFYLKDPDLNSVRTMLNYKCQAWCLFTVENGGDLSIERLTVKNEVLLDDVLDSLFTTIAYTPKNQKCEVKMDWPEYGTDHFLFKRLIEQGWKTDGLIKDKYTGYGELWDGIKLKKVF